MFCSSQRKSLDLPKWQQHGQRKAYGNPGNGTDGRPRRFKTGHSLMAKLLQDTLTSHTWLA